MSFCGACGAPVAAASAKFCAGCGAALALSPAPLAPPAPPTPAAAPTAAPPPPPPPMLPPLKAAKKTNSGAFVVGFLSVMLLAGGITFMLMRDDTPAPLNPASTTVPATTGP